MKKIFLISLIIVLLVGDAGIILKNANFFSGKYFFFFFFYAITLQYKKLLTIKKNNMKNLTEKEMETVNGGFNWGCFFSVAGLVLSGIEYAATPVTGGFGAVVGSLTYAVSIGGIATSCE